MFDNNVSDHYWGLLCTNPYKPDSKNHFVDFEAGTLSRAAYIPQEPQTKMRLFGAKTAIIFKCWLIYKGKLAIATP